MNKRLDIRSRLLAALRARFALHIWRCHIVNLASKFPDLYSTSRSFISAPSFNILNRLCDSLLTLTLIYAEHYPDTPFCPWLLGSQLVEHFFGISRMLLPDFTFSQFLTLIKHVMLRQRLLLSGKFQEKRERGTREGYIFDFDDTPLTPAELDNARVRLTRADVDAIVELAHTEAVKLTKDLLHMPTPPLPFKLAPLSGPPRSKKASQFNRGKSDGEESDEESDEDLNGGVEGEKEKETTVDVAPDLDEVVSSAAADAAREAILGKAEEELEQYVAAAEDVDVDMQTAPTPLREEGEHQYTPTQSPSGQAPPKSTIVINDKLSVQGIVDTREGNSSRTNVKSQRVALLDPKFTEEMKKATSKPMDKTALKQKQSAASREATNKISVREASHRVRVAQDVDPDQVRPQTAREVRWQETVKRVVLLMPSGTRIPVCIYRHTFVPTFHHDAPSRNSPLTCHFFPNRRRCPQHQSQEYQWFLSSTQGMLCPHAEQIQGRRSILYWRGS